MDEARTGADEATPRKNRGGRKAVFTKSERITRRRLYERERTRRRRQEALERDKFVCGVCGGTFSLPTGVRGQTPDEIRTYTKIGGKTVCQVCAQKRYPKRARNLEGGVLGEGFVAPSPSSMITVRRRSQS